MSDKTSTEFLRQLLDERGVEWIDFDGEPTWMGNDRMHYARQECSCDEPTDEVTVYHLTPEQAVDATLGRGTCKFEYTLADNGWADHTCSECGYVENLDVHVSLGWHYCPNCGKEIVE